jgi:hypothetical protein
MRVAISAIFPSDRNCRCHQDQFSGLNIATVGDFARTDRRTADIAGVSVFD